MVRTSAVDYKPKFATPRQLVCSSPESRLSRSAYALATAQCRLLPTHAGTVRRLRAARPRRQWQLVGTFGALTVSLPCVRLLDGDGREKEWRSQTIQAYKRLTKRAEAIIANTYLAGTNTRRVRRALAGLFGGKVGKDAVSRA